ncbi:galanin receptor type 1b [Synchiropus splendidus]|uniref:galanin receptor type 1b n=1 Tax=Synchiropus splendidus TaxID=270530 RepID=UPI00237DFDB5|nr:galanin receptor type 1b [Synchiropus splendidus]
MPPGNGSSGWEQLHGQSAGAEALIVPVVFGLIFVVGLVGNCLVLLVMGRLRSRRAAGRAPSSSSSSCSPTNMFIVNLSVADLLFLLVCVPLHATIYSLPEWLFGDFLCRFGHFFTSVTMLVSIFTLVAMSADRYVAVVRSKVPRVRSRRNTLAALALVWTLSVVCSVPVAQHHVLSGHRAAPNSTFCWEQWSGASRRTYKVTVLLVGFVVPLLIISWCYTKVLFHLHMKMKNISKKSKRSKKKTAQTILLVVTGFTVCWLPHHVIAMWAEFGTFPLNDASFAFRIIGHCLSYGNSCINPVLYAFLSENFRGACRQVFGRRAALNGATVRFRTENFSTTHSAL